MGETMCKYKNAFQVPRFLEMYSFTAIRKGEEGISWQEIFILYKMCGENDMLNEPMNGAKKRASLQKQLQAFKKCAKGIINNGMEETDQNMFTPSVKKKGQAAKFRDHHESGDDKGQHQHNPRSLNRGC